MDVMEDLVEFSGVEDAFQAGKRLFAEGQVEKAHEKLVLACVRAPDMELYRLHEQFVGSRVAGKFADPEETRGLASKLARAEMTAAFASYVLGYLALETGDQSTAVRHFENAFRLDREMLDAGRQLRRLGLDSGRVTPTGSIQVPVPTRAPRAPKKPRSREMKLLGVLAFVLMGTVGYVAATRAGVFADYVEVR